MMEAYEVAYPPQRQQRPIFVLPDAFDNEEREDATVSSKEEDEDAQQQQEQLQHEQQEQEQHPPLQMRAQSSRDLILRQKARLQVARNQRLLRVQQSSSSAFSTPSSTPSLVSKDGDDQSYTDLSSFAPVITAESLAMSTWMTMPAVIEGTSTDAILSASSEFAVTPKTTTEQSNRRRRRGEESYDDDDYNYQYDENVSSSSETSSESSSSKCIEEELHGDSSDKDAVKTTQNRSNSSSPVYPEEMSKSSEKDEEMGSGNRLAPEPSDKTPRMSNHKSLDPCCEVDAREKTTPSATANSFAASSGWMMEAAAKLQAFTNDYLSSPSATGEALDSSASRIILDTSGSYSQKHQQSHAGRSVNGSQNRDDDAGDDDISVEELDLEELAQEIRSNKTDLSGHSDKAAAQEVMQANAGMTDDEKKEDDADMILDQSMEMLTSPQVSKRMQDSSPPPESVVSHDSNGRSLPPPILFNPLEFDNPTIPRPVPSHAGSSETGGGGGSQLVMSAPRFSEDPICVESKSLSAGDKGYHDVGIWKKAASSSYSSFRPPLPKQPPVNRARTNGSPEPQTHSQVTEILRQKKQAMSSISSLKQERSLTPITRMRQSSNGSEEFVPDEGFRPYYSAEKIPPGSGQENLRNESRKRVPSSKRSRNPTGRKARWERTTIKDEDATTLEDTADDTTNTPKNRSSSSKTIEKRGSSGRRKIKGMSRRKSRRRPKSCSIDDDRYAALSGKLIPCQENFHLLIAQLIQGRCGHLGDALSVDEYDDDYTDEDEDESLETDDSYSMRDDKLRKTLVVSFDDESVADVIRRRRLRDNLSKPPIQKSKSTGLPVKQEREVTNRSKGRAERKQGAPESSKFVEVEAQQPHRENSGSRRRLERERFEKQADQKQGRTLTKAHAERQHAKLSERQEREHDHAERERMPSLKESRELDRELQGSDGWEQNLGPAATSQHSKNSESSYSTASNDAASPRDGKSSQTSISGAFAPDAAAQSRKNKNTEEATKSTGGVAQSGNNENQAASESKSLEVGIHDRSFIKAFVTTATTGGLKLLFHTHQRRESFSPPTKVFGFIKFGIEGAKGQYSEPRLSWETETGVPKGVVDIFDIRSLNKASTADLENYPLAIPGRSVVLQTTKGSNYLFEAPTEDRALRFVHGVRWVVARLAFNLIIGNIHVSCELLDTDEKEGSDGFEGQKAMNDAANHLVDKASLI